MNKGMISSDGKWEYLMINGVLFITSEQDRDNFVALSEQAQKELVRYILDKDLQHSSEQ